MTKPYKCFPGVHLILTIVMTRAGREVGRAVPDDRTPFFLSYARARDGAGNRGRTHDSDKWTSEFFIHLSDDVAQLIPRTPGADIGYMDTGTQGGADWEEELLHAAGTCQVLVALLSAPYLSSEWCGMEWFAFSQRASRAAPGRSAAPRQGHIIPVRWAPIEYALPSPVKQAMIFSPTAEPDPELPTQYKANGIYGLRQMGLKDPYKIVVWQLALHISRIYHNRRLAFREYRREDLRNAFNGAGS
jgi:TIR domain